MCPSILYVCLCSGWGFWAKCFCQTSSTAVSAPDESLFRSSYTTISSLHFLPLSSFRLWILIAFLFFPEVNKYLPSLLRVSLERQVNREMRPVLCVMSLLPTFLIATAKLGLLKQLRRKITVTVAEYWKYQVWYIRLLIFINDVYSVHRSLLRLLYSRTNADFSFIHFTFSKLF